MRLFNNLVDSYRNKNYAEFEKLCKSSTSLDADSYLYLIDLLEEEPDVWFAYDVMMSNLYLEWSNPELFFEEEEEEEE